MRKISELYRFAIWFILFPAPAVWASPLAFVASAESNNLVVIDLASSPPALVANISLSGAGVNSVVVSPDGATAYVTEQSAGGIAVIQTSNWTKVATISTAVGAYAAAITPDGSTLYVANGTPTNSVSVISTVSRTVIKTITSGVSVGGSLASIALTPDGSHLWVTDKIKSQILFINTATNQVESSLATPNGPVAIAFTADGTSAYVACQSAQQILVINTANKTVTHTITNAPLFTPDAIVLSPDGASAYVSNAVGGTPSVVVINTLTNVVKAVIPVPMPTGNLPEGIAVTPDGKQLFVAMALSAAVGIVSTVSQTQTDYLPGNPGTTKPGYPRYGWIYPSGIAIWPQTTVPPPVSVSVSPLSASLLQGQTQLFTATVINSTNANVTWSISPNVGSLSTAGPSTTVTYTAPPTIATVQTVKLIATTVADGTKTAAATITLNPPPPVSVSLTPTSASLNGGQAQLFTATVTNAPNVNVTWSISPGVGSLSTVGPSTAVTYTAPSPVTSAQTITLTGTSVTDTSKKATAAIALIPDTTPPGCSNGKPSGTLPLGTTQTTMSLTTTEPATCRYSTTPNTAYGSMTNTFTTTGGTTHSQLLLSLTDGSAYHYYIRCKDVAGNPDTNDYPITFSVASPGADTQPPTIPTGLAASVLSSSQIKLTWNASTDDVGVTGYDLYRDGSIIKTGTSLTFTDTGLTPSTAYSYTVDAFDAAGNHSFQSSPPVVATTQPPPDTTPPGRANGAPSGILPLGTQQTTLSLTTTEAATCRYSTTPNTAYNSMTTTFSTTGGLNHSTNVSGLVNGTSYTYYVRCKDTAGNFNTSDYLIAFSVASSPTQDTEKPSIPTNLSAQAISSSQITLTWTASTDNIGVTGYQIYRSGLPVATATTTTYTNPGLAASTSYTYTVAAFDKAGNISDPSQPASDTTLPSTGDSPVLSDITAIASATGAVITWTTDQSADSQVYYGESQTYGQSVIDSTLVTSHTLTLTGLTPDVLYHFQVKSANSSGNLGVSPDGTFTTPSSSATLPVPDLSGWPSIMPVNATLTLGSYSVPDVSFEWTAASGISASQRPAQTPFLNVASLSAPVSTKTQSLSLGLASWALSPGMYTITVQAQAGTNVSPTASATVTLVEADLNSARVFPNPWRSDKHAGKNMTFDQLAQGSTVKIFTVSGHLVRSLDASAGSAAWDLANDSGDKVASGLYIYLITDGQDEKARGKVAVIR